MTENGRSNTYRGTKVKFHELSRAVISLKAEANVNIDDTS